MRLKSKYRKVLLLFFVLFLLLSAFSIYSFYRQSPQDVVISNRTDRSFTVSWVTESPTRGVALAKEGGFILPGKIFSLTGLKGYDDRDRSKAELAAAELNIENSRGEISVDSDNLNYEVEVSNKGEYFVHHITFSGLQPEQDYGVMVGNGIFFTKVSDLYTGDITVRTFPSADSVRTPSPAYGKVTRDGEHLTDGVAYLTVDFGSEQNSQLLSAPINTKNGSFYFDLSNARTREGNFIEDIGDDSLEIIWVNAGPLGGVPTLEFLSNQDAPFPPMELDQDLDVDYTDSGISEELSLVPAAFASLDDRGGTTSKIPGGSPDSAPREQVCNKPVRIGSCVGTSLQILCADDTLYSLKENAERCNPSGTDVSIPGYWDGGYRDGTGEGVDETSESDRTYYCQAIGCHDEPEDLGTLCDNNDECSTGYCNELFRGQQSRCDWPPQEKPPIGGHDVPGYAPGVRTREECDTGCSQECVISVSDSSLLNRWVCPSSSKDDEMVEAVKLQSRGKLDVSYTDSLINDVAAGASSDTERVQFLPEEGKYYIEEDGVYRFRYEEEEYEAYLDEGVDTVSIYIDENDNGSYDEGVDRVIAEDPVELNIRKSSDMFTYDIRSGFNFVSFPFIPDSESAGVDDINSAASFLSYLNDEYDDAFYHIAKFDSGWKPVGENIEAYSSTDFQISPGEGYLLRAKRDLTLALAGKKVIYDSDDDSAPIHFDPGWNLIGLYGTGVKDYTADSLIDGIGRYEEVSLTADNVTRWESDRTQYLGYQKELVEGQENIYGFDFPLDKQTAYFVRVIEGSGLWQLELAAVTPSGGGGSSTDPSCEDITDPMQCYEEEGCEGVYGPSYCSGQICTTDETFQECTQISDSRLAEAEEEKALCEDSNGSWTRSRYDEPGSCVCPDGAQFYPGRGCDDLLEVDPELIERAEEDPVDIVISLDVGYVPEGELEEEEVIEQRERISSAQDEIIELLSDTDAVVQNEYTTVPQMALSVEAESLQLLIDSDIVIHIQENIPDPTAGSGSSTGE